MTYLTRTVLGIVPNSVTDVGPLYMALQRTDVEATRVKFCAIQLGHIGLLDRALEVLGTQPTREELAEALRNAVPDRGFSIDDPNTSVGSLYQRLFPTDFARLSVQFVSQDGTVITRPYVELPRENKDEVNIRRLKTLGFLS